MRKRELPKIIKQKSQEGEKESGCCFRSCGGIPGVQNHENSKSTNIKKLKAILKK